MASKIGVADSSRYLRNHSSWMLRLGAPGGYSPTKLLERLGPTLAAESSGVEGLHVFTFNQVQESEQWRRQLLGQIPARAAPVGPMRTGAGEAAGGDERLSLTAGRPQSSCVRGGRRRAPAARR